MERASHNNKAHNEFHNNVVNLQSKLSRSKDTVSWQKNILCHLNGCGCSSNPFIWVSEILHCVYFEIPKTGSSSIKSIINRPEYRFSQFWDSPGAAAKCFQDYYKFTVIRHPIARMLSNYKMFCLSDNECRHRQIETLFDKAHELISLDEFIGLATIYRNHHWEKMVNYLPLEPGNKPLAQIDRILCTETLEIDWRDVQRELNMPYVLPWNNSCAHIQYNAELQEKTLRNIESQYAEDLLLYNRCRTT